MKLYFSPGSSSQAAHIALREAGVAVRLVKVDLRNRTTADHAEFTHLNPFGYVPVLEFDDGATLREVTAILLFAADRAPGAQLAPASGTMERLRLFEWLSFLATEMHGCIRCAGVQAPKTADWTNALEKQFAWIDLQLVYKPFLMGGCYTVADIYLWVMSNWMRPTKLNGGAEADFGLRRFANLQRWHETIAARDAVAAALAAERS